jgi:uncharacterized membrane protein
MATFLGLVAIFWALPIWVANGLGQDRNRSNGWVYGFLLGWVGVFILSLTSALPTQAELELRALEAQHKLNEMRRVTAG